MTDADDLAVYNSDWLGKYHGQAPVALLPKTTAQVSAALAYCNDRRYGRRRGVGRGTWRYRGGLLIARPPACLPAT